MMRLLNACRYAPRAPIQLGAVLAAAWVIPEIAAANPIPVNGFAAPRGDALTVSGVAILVCVAALVAESICVALMSGRRNWESIGTWLAVTSLTFFAFILAPSGDWAPISPAGPRLMQSMVAEALVVLVEGVVLWRMWFRSVPKGAGRAFGIALLGNLVSLAVGGLYAFVA